jgi:hypothetical protein
MNDHTHTISGGTLLLAEITSGSVGGHLAHALGAVPPWLGGAVTALLVGVTLRVADATLRDLGERLHARARAALDRVMKRPPSAP